MKGLQASLYLLRLSPEYPPCKNLGSCRHVKTLTLLATLLLLAGCAHWEQMTQHEKNVVVGTALAGLVIGAVVNDDDNDRHDHCVHPHRNCGD
jgi:hypothetical protein